MCTWYWHSVQQSPIDLSAVCSAAHSAESHTSVYLQDHLLALHKKLEYAERSEAARSSEAWRDVAPELERLRAKAAAKSHDFLMARCVS